MKYVAGTKTIRLTNIEEANPFLKLGRKIAFGKHLPLTKSKMDKRLLRSAQKKTDVGNQQSDFFYMVK